MPINHELQWEAFLHDPRSGQFSVSVLSYMQPYVRQMDTVLAARLDEPATLESLAAAAHEFVGWLAWSELFKLGSIEQAFAEMPAVMASARFALEEFQRAASDQMVALCMISTGGEFAIRLLHKDPLFVYSSWIRRTTPALVDRFLSGKLTIRDIVERAPGLIFFGLV